LAMGVEFRLITERFQVQLGNQIIIKKISYLETARSLQHGITLFTHQY
jgi:hypothetical protein